MRVILAQPRGFCAGVVRAIDIVEKALEIYGPPVYVRHEIVHNRRVVESLRTKGAVFVEEVSDVPDGAVVIFSAHGISAAVENEAQERNLPIIDATCPLVSKVHKEGQNHAGAGREVILIGHDGHPEVEGTRGRIKGGAHLVATKKDVENLNVRDPNKVAYVTQTTLSVDDTREVINTLKTRFPAIVGPDVRDICYATQNRQQAVRSLARQVDLILVMGARNSSNSNRLCEIGREMGIPSYLIDDSDGLEPEWLKGIETVGITAGASAPEELVQELIERLGDFCKIEVEVLGGIEENVTFRLPAELVKAAHAKTNSTQGSQT